MTNGAISVGHNIYSTGAITLTGGTVTMTASKDFATNTGLVMNGGTLDLGIYAAKINNATQTAGGFSMTGSGTLKTTIGASATGALDLSTNAVTWTNAGQTLTIVPTVSGYSVKSGDKFLVVNQNAAGTTTTTGTISVSNSGLISWTATKATGAVTDAYGASSIGDKDIYLTASIANATSIAGVSSASAGAINALSTTGAPATLASAVQSLSSSELPKAGDQLRPAANGGMAQAAQAVTGGVLTTIGNRSDAVRQAANGGTGINSGETLRGMGVWAEGFGGVGDQGKRQDIDGYSIATGGLAGGVDFAVTPATRVGVAFGYARSAVDGKGNNRQDRTSIDSYQGSLYATYTGSPWYVNGSASVGLHQYNATRYQSFTGFSDRATSDHNGYQYTAAIDGGYPIAVAGAVLTPVVGAQYSYLTQDGYTESSSNGAGLRVNSQDHNSYRSMLGAKASKTFTLDGGEKLTPEFRAKWLHEFNAKAVDTISTFAGGGSSFTTTGVKPAAETFVVGIGATMVNKDDLSLVANYDAELRDQFVGHKLSLNLRQEF
ncbi:autotransporter outer membrane beta-barrel domain-containing protein [Magnetospirillum sp. 15-1]|uniref:autotransporter family protein n=1 Tax=Magnetospirillum sp. 15-1 TaxID=1979370 RepID=UPI001482B845|nr:autotransporter outer membrane beta-barrel domain-containing protein [Magnetospirillum sp. 15-1]